MWESWGLVKDFACRCPIGFGGVDCSVVEHVGRCGDKQVLDRGYDADAAILTAECYVVQDAVSEGFGLRHHWLKWELDLRKGPGAGTSSISLWSRNKDDAYHARSSSHPDGGGQHAAKGSRWDPTLGMKGGDPNEWRSCGPANENLRCDMSSCSPASGKLATAGGMECAVSKCTSCYPSNPLCGQGFSVIALGGDTASLRLTSVHNDTGLGSGFLRLGIREFAVACTAGRCVGPSSPKPSSIKPSPTEPLSMAPTAPSPQTTPLPRATTSQPPPLKPENRDASPVVYVLLLLAAHALAAVSVGPLFLLPASSICPHFRPCPRLKP
jgi:hypothetical protein